MRHLVEFRDEGAGLSRRRDRRRRASSSAGQRVKVSGISKGKGFQGTIKRHRFSRGPAGHGSHNVRAPGSIGASATPSRVFKGIRGPGQMGNKRVTQRGLEVVEVRAEREPAASCAARCRAPATATWRCAPMADAPVLGGARASKVALDDTAFGARFNGPLLHESVRAELAARRRGTASTKTRGLVSGGNSKPWRQKGTGRARAGSTRSPIFAGGGAVFGPHPRSYVFKVNRKERRAALRSALSLHAERGSIAILDASAFEEPSTKAAAALLARLGPAALDAGRRRRRRARRRALVPQHRPRRGARARRASGSPTSSARPRCCAPPRRSRS